MWKGTKNELLLLSGLRSDWFVLILLRAARGVNGALDFAMYMPPLAYRVLFRSVWDWHKKAACAARSNAGGRVHDHGLSSDGWL